MDQKFGSCEKTAISCYLVWEQWWTQVRWLVRTSDKWERCLNSWIPRLCLLLVRGRCCYWVAKWITPHPELEGTHRDKGCCQSFVPRSDRESWHWERMLPPSTQLCIFTLSCLAPTEREELLSWWAWAKSVRQARGRRRIRAAGAHSQLAPLLRGGAENRPGLQAGTHAPKLSPCWGRWLTPIHVTNTLGQHPAWKKL